jgi:hypothetical protein
MLPAGCLRVACRLLTDLYPAENRAGANSLDTEGYPATG